MPWITPAEPPDSVAACRPLASRAFSPPAPPAPFPPPAPASPPATLAPWASTAPLASSASLARPPAPAGLAADQADRLVRDELMEDPDGVGTAADAGDHCVRQPPGGAITCARASTPITRWKSRTISGNGCGPITEPMQ